MYLDVHKLLMIRVQEAVSVKRTASVALSKIGFAICMDTIRDEEPH